MKIPPAIQRAIDRIQALPPVALLLEIMAAYNLAGGGLLAAGLAYAALFAALTVLLFVVGIVGFVVSDPTVREQIVDEIAAQIPPLEPIVHDGLLVVSSSAGALSVLGLIALGWSASQFYGSIDAAFGRIFHRAPIRGPIERIVRGVLSVLIVVGALAAAIVTTTIQAAVEDRTQIAAGGEVGRMMSALAYPAFTVVLAVVGVGLLYRLVPNTHVPWGVLVPPALVAGTAIGLLAELFVFLAPRLVGGLQVFGAFAAVFAALIWLSWTFQVLLLGAAWTRARLPESDPVPGPQVDEAVLAPDLTAPPAGASGRPGRTPEPTVNEGGAPSVH